MTYPNVVYPIPIGQRVIGIRVVITRYLGDDPQPGIVECESIDANGQRHLFVERTARVTWDDIDSKSVYPSPGAIACQIVDRYRNESNREFIVVNTREPDGIESTDEIEEFSVLAESLIEWDFGSTIERKWNGIA